jgi:hypothetical protein
MDCIYPGMVDTAREKFTDYIENLRDELRFPYPAFRMPQAVSGVDAPHVDDKHCIDGSPIYVLPLRIGNGWTVKPSYTPPQVGAETVKPVVELSRIKKHQTEVSKESNKHGKKSRSNKRQKKGEQSRSYNLIIWTLAAC